MKYRILGPTDTSFADANIAVTVDYTDLAALGSGATGSINIAPFTQTSLQDPTISESGNQLPAGTRIKVVGVNVTTAFTVSDAGNTLTMTVGDTGSAARYLASSQVLSGATPITFSAGTGTGFVLTSADNIILALAAQSAHAVNAATAGSMTFYLKLDDMNTWVIP